MGVIEELMSMQVASDGRYGYSLVSGYDDPPSSGVTNCSAWIRFCAKAIEPNSEMAQMSWSYTGVMAKTGESVASGRGMTPFPYDIARSGDVILLSYDRHNQDYDHVELFLGTEAQGNWTGSECWGAGYAPAPHRSGNASAVVSRSFEWELRRIGWECANTANVNHYAASVKAMQRFLLDRHYYTGLVDGAIDRGFSITVLALQRYLGDRRYYRGLFDGVFDDGVSMTVKALQSMLSDFELYEGDIDGKIDAHDSLTMAACMGLETIGA